MRVTEKLKVCTPSTLCSYHEMRVGVSEIPPPEVYSQSGFEAIHQITDARKNQTSEYSEFSLNKKLHTVLDVVNSYWLENVSLLDGILREHHEDWEKEVHRRVKYPAHGWMSSPQQFSQLVETLHVLRENKTHFDRWLILGTASGANTEQLVNTLDQINVHPKLFVLDRCQPPVKDSLAPDRYGVTADALRLSFSNGSVDIVSSHFTSSFIPTEEQRISEGLSRDEAMERKTRLFQEVYRVLSDGGVFIAAVGTPIGFPNSNEIINTAIRAGFAIESIILVPTTDPTCYDANTRKHIPKNFFLVAIKGTA